MPSQRSAPRRRLRSLNVSEPVPAVDLSGTTADGENLFEKNVRWARFQLSQEGVITSPKRGVWALT